MKINKLLIANRGEIAVRVIRSAQEMGITTVAVYSDADREGLHVKLADEAYRLGPAPSSESYLLGDKVIEIAKQCGAQAIHPGFGFLSENAGFSEAVTKAGLIFVGPSPHAIRVMGSKLESKQTVAKYDVPLVPGTEEAITDIEEAKKIAADIGFPILIKASAGGGGKGMRIVEDQASFEEQMNLAKSEARSAFGDDAVFIEKYVRSPRHIEIQVLADQQGNTVYLFERECSVQRRHQKVIEEAPSAILTPEMRKEMGETAVRVAQSCDYEGAGTVEFLIDDTMNFYFLEMNTRLQVEHPVTELITGKDLVKEQIKVAQGEPLSFKQEDLTIYGHAVELRIYAEDPANNFLPDIGKLEKYRKPEGIGIRVDDGYAEGMDIPIYYDPMLAKLITWGSDRTEAIDRMKRAIDEYNIVGVKNTLNFGRFVMNHEAFTSGKFDTHFVKQYWTGDDGDKPGEAEEKIAVILAKRLFEEQRDNQLTASENSANSRWRDNRLQYRN